jgi:hypothetical protein
MWNTDSLWFEVAIVSGVILLGHIFLGHFEEQSPKLRKLGKYLASLVLVVTVSIFLGRAVALTLFALMFIPVLYIHMIWLPKKGINGWTGEPKEKYYELRGWNKNIFANPGSEKEKGDT